MVMYLFFLLFTTVLLIQRSPSHRGIQASHCKKILRTPKIFKFKDILKDRFTSTHNYWLLTHTAKQHKNL